MIWNILVWCVFGLVAGGIARFLVPGRDPMGCLGTIALGVVGSLLGGFIASLIQGGDRDALSGVGMIGSVIGAILVLLLIRQFRRPRRI